MQSLKRLAPAKINLHLHITGRMENGFHALDSLVAFTNYSDEITVRVSQEFSLKVLDTTGAEIELDCPTSDNLITRATYALAEKKNLSPNVAIELIKRIPVAAGLGGGSADAAAILLSLKDIWPVVAQADITEIAADLGSDIVACLYKKPVIMRDTGNKIVEAPVMPTLYGILVNPCAPCSTPLVYKTYAQNKAEFSKDVAFPERFETLDTLYHFLNENTSNDLTDAAIQVAPVIETVLNTIKESTHCRLSRLSGSGATCFGLFDTYDHAVTAAKAIKETHQNWWVEPVIVNNL